MKLLRQLSIVLIMSFAGEIIHKLLITQVPGSIIGMLILFLCLCTGIVKLEMISDISKFLLDHLAFFFIPAGVGITLYMGILKENWLPILIISFVSTILVMVSTGYAVQLLKGGRKS